MSYQQKRECSEDTSVVSYQQKRECSEDTSVVSYQQKRSVVKTLVYRFGTMEPQVVPKGLVWCQ